jgi:hypothetical protein
MSAAFSETPLGFGVEMNLVPRVATMRGNPGLSCSIPLGLAKRKTNIENGAVQMSPEITTVLTLVGSILAAGTAYVFTKWRERETEWQKEKRECYKEFAVALNDFFFEKTSPEKEAQFVCACNKLNLIAPQAVIEAIAAFNEQHSGENSFETKISKVFFEMRKDLNISPKDYSKTFCVKIWQPQTRK